jgi:hypothetical protein
MWMSYEIHDVIVCTGQRGDAFCLIVHFFIVRIIEVLHEFEGI